MALLAGACGDDEPETADAATDQSEADLPDGAPMKIAAFFLASGPLQGQKEGIDVLEAWAGETNENGGIDGRPVELVVFDTRGEQATAAALAEEVGNDPSFVAALSMDGATDQASIEVLSRSGVPVIGGSGFEPMVWGAGQNAFFEAEGLPNVFGITTAFPALTFAIVVAGQQAGVTKVVGLDMAEIASTKQGTQLVEEISGLVGLEFVGGVTVSASQPDFTAECIRFVQEGADYVQLTGPAPAMARRIVADCATQGYTGYFGVTGGAVTPELYDNIGDAKLTGGLTSFPWFVNAEPVDHYREVLSERGVSDAVVGTPAATAVWATLELFKKTLTSNASSLEPVVTREQVISLYNTIADETLDGLLPQALTFADGRATPEPPQCFWVYTYQGGEFEGSIEPTCPGPEFDPVTTGTGP